MIAAESLPMLAGIFFCSPFLRLVEYVYIIAYFPFVVNHLFERRYLHA